MAESAGKRLSDARKALGLSVDDAAHGTRMRPDKILALENDDYSRFPGNSYARGFLQIYSRFLSVDLSKELRTLDTGHKVDVGEYQYLNHAPEPTPIRTQVFRADRPPSLAPLMLMVAAFAVVAWLVWMVVSVQRLRLDELRNSAVETSAAPVPAAAAESAAVASAEGSEIQPIPLAAEPADPLPATGSSGVAVSPHEPETAALAPVPPAGSITTMPLVSAAPLAQPVPPASTINELVVEPLKTTWVKVREGAEGTPPVFEGFLSPNTRPLKLRGTRFFVEVRDESAVQIRKNGHPIAYQAPGISVQ